MPVPRKIVESAPQPSPKRPHQEEIDSIQTVPGSEPSTTTFLPQYDASVGTTSIFRLSTPANKKPKRSNEQAQNRKDVVEAGGQCLSCRANRSKVVGPPFPLLLANPSVQPACLGDQTCSQCLKDGLECIRPTLKDKNVFIESRSCRSILWDYADSPDRAGLRLSAYSFF